MESVSSINNNYELLGFAIICFLSCNKQPLEPVITMLIRVLWAFTHSSLWPLIFYRYVQYFTKLLTGNIELRNEPVFLQHVMLHGVPRGNSTGDSLRVFVKLYCNMKHVYTSSVLWVLWHCYQYQEDNVHTDFAFTVLLVVVKFFAKFNKPLNNNFISMNFKHQDYNIWIHEFDQSEVSCWIIIYVYFHPVR